MAQGTSHGKVLIGNWQEELAYQRDRRDQMAIAKSHGGTLTMQIMSKMGAHKQVTTLAPMLSDGFLRFNAPIMIQNAGSEGFLSTDLDDKASAGAGAWKYYVSTAVSDRPQARNTFVVLPVDETTRDGIVCYGQRVRIATTAPLTDEPLYLSSVLKTPTSFSRQSRHNEVFLSAGTTTITTWMIHHGNADYRPEMEGQPVKANAIVQLLHIQTNTPLASTQAKFCNDFGAEFEVCGHRFMETLVKVGTSKELPVNMWAFVTAPPSDSSASSPTTTAA
jgi:hypothetical protein